MGMAASQARFLGLTARKTNTEYEGQQVNQQRTALANQSAGLFNRMLALEVPVPPDVTNYYKTSYTYTKTEGSVESSFEIISGLGNPSCVVEKTTKNDIITSNKGYADKTTFVYKSQTSSGAEKWYISFNSKDVNPKVLTEMKSASGDEYKSCKDQISKIMEDLYKTAGDTRDPASTGTQTPFIIKNPETGKAEALTYGFMSKFKDEDGNSKAVYLDENNKLVTTKPSDDAVAVNWTDFLSFEETDTYGGLTALQTNKLYYFSDTDSSGNTVTQYVQASSLGANTKGTFSENEVTIPDGIKETFYDRYYNEYSQITYNNCSWIRDSSGRPVQFTGTNSDTEEVEGPYDLTINSVKDDTAYQSAMSNYVFEKALYDKEIADINAQTESIQAQDRTLELRLRQLDTEQKALQNELEAVQKVIKDNVEKTFKTFAN